MGWFGVLAAACFAVHLAILSLTDASAGPLLIAPEAGLALAGLLLGGRKLWPAILIGTFAALLMAPAAISLSSAFGLALVETAAAWLGAALFHRIGGDNPTDLGDLPKVGAAALLTVAIGSVGSALVLAAPIPSLPAITARMAIGMLIAVPLLLAWAGARPLTWSAGRALHVATLTLTTATISAVISFGDGTETIAWSLFPVLIWSAVAFQRRGATMANAILATFLTIGTAFDHGPFAPGTELGSAAFGQICLAVIAVTLLVLAERADARATEAQVRETATLLRQREEQMALFVDNVPSAVAIFDLEMRYLAASRRYRGDCGIALDLPLVGRSHYELFPDLPPRWRGIYDRVLAGEELSNPEEHWAQPDGTVAIVRWKMKPWLDGLGRIAGLMLFIEVITAEFEARRRIEAAEARYRGVFDQAAVGVARLSLQGRYLDVNDRGCEILRRTREELFAADYELVLPGANLPDDISAAREMVAGARRSYTVEKQIGDPDEPLWILLTVSLVRDADGAPDCFVSVIQDITERKRVEADLHESEARLRLAQEAAGVGVWEMDLDRGVIIHSPVSLAMHMLPKTEDGALSLRELATHFDPEITAETTRRLERAVLEGIPYDNTFRLELPDGGERWIHSVGRHERGSGVLGRIQGASIDITAFRQSESRVVEAHEKLLRLSRLSAMGAMASTLAHELNQPLTAVSNYAEACHQLVLSRDDAADEALVAMLERTSSEAMRAGDIIRAIRRFTITGEIAPKAEDLRALVARVWSYESARAAKVRFETSFARNANMVLVDRTQMEQVFINLIRNALEAMSECPVRRLTIKATVEESGVVVRVRDTGPGLSKDALANLFDPFRTTKPNGMGLGLPICRTIVEAHRGRLWAENSADGGAIFYILLPSAAADKDHGHAEDGHAE